ncbi:MAG TPA: hypothetical protein DEB25_09035 [Desulfobulbaceae bacterium]|nr:hypothetical protein [Desulfobulbaceae bacterium]
MAERVPWGDFPPVIANDRMGSLRWDGKNIEAPQYAAAKSGDDWQAALTLVERKLKPDTIGRIGSFLRQRGIDFGKMEILPVDAIEAGGRNKIPLAMAKIISEKLGRIAINTEIKQADKVGRSGTGINHRLAFMPSFAGDVAQKNYLIVDDTLRVGGTVANLRGYVERNGGKIVGVFVMQSDEQSLTLQPNEKIYNKLYSKHGKEKTDEFCKRQFGFDSSCLTCGEAGNIAAAASLNDIARRIESAREHARRIGLEVDVATREAGRLATTRSPALDQGRTGNATAGLKGVSGDRLTEANRPPHDFHILATVFWLATEQESPNEPADKILETYPELSGAVAARKSICQDISFTNSFWNPDNVERLKLATDGIRQRIAQGRLQFDNKEIDSIKSVALERHKEFDAER